MLEHMFKKKVSIDFEMGFQLKMENQQLIFESSDSWDYVYLGHQVSLGIAASDSWHYATPYYPGSLPWPNRHAL